MSKCLEQSLAADVAALEKKKKAFEEFISRYPRACEILSRAQPDAVLSWYGDAMPDVFMAIPDEVDAAILDSKFMNKLENLCDTDLSELIGLAAADITYKDDRKRHPVHQSCVYEIIKAGGIINL